MKVTAEAIWADLVKIRETRPLIHNITNYVVMNTTANALLSLGASPVMAHAEEEVEDMVLIARALVINIGTLSQHWVRSMHRAMHRAQERGIPIVLDPVGAGATPYRTDTFHQLLAVARPSIIRGNASEIAALVQSQALTKGVDSTTEAEQVVDLARQLSQIQRCTVCVSGGTDFIVDKDITIKILNGHPLMPRVTGLGCTATALCGAFASVNDSPVLATAYGMAVLGIAGEWAAERSEGPGTLQLHILDGLYQMDEAMIAARLRVGE